MTTPASPGNPSPEKRALIAAYEEAVKSGSERAAVTAPPRRRRGLHPVATLALVVLVGVLAWLAVAQPDWIFHRGMPPQSPAVREASLRLAMALQYQRIERFRDSAGRLPAQLAETGPSLGNLTYTTTQFGGFVLEGADSEFHLTLRSGDSLRAFVGKSYETLDQRGTR